VDDVGIAEGADEARPIGHLSNDRAGELDPSQGAQRPRRDRVDRHQPRVDIWIVPPGAEKTVGLDRLPPDINSQRGCDDRNAMTVSAGHARATVQTTRPSSILLQAAELNGSGQEEEHRVF
jgi:hypothetical protein